MKFFRKKVPASVFGRWIAIVHVEPEICWRSVCMLRDYKVPGPIATFEMAFARAAMLKSHIKFIKRDPIRGIMLEAVDTVIQEAFAPVEDTELTLEHYDGLSLMTVAPERVKYYEDNAFPFQQLASVVGLELGVSGFVSFEISQIFEALIENVEHEMKQVRIVLK